MQIQIQISEPVSDKKCQKFNSINYNYNLKPLLIDLQYFPVVDYYSTLYRYSDIVFEQYESHQKMSFRNRCIIAGANGTINLTVPLAGGRDQKSLAKDVKIDNTFNWQIRQIRAIISSYNRSPYFEFYSDSIQQLFTRKPVFLFDWNLECLSWLKDKTGLKSSFTRSLQFDREVSDESCKDLRNSFLPNNMNRKNATGVTYRQVFEDRFGFQPGLSVLDFLFCAGRRAVEQAGIAKAGIDLNQ